VGTVKNWTRGTDRRGRAEDGERLDVDALQDVVFARRIKKMEVDDFGVRNIGAGVILEVMVVDTLIGVVYFGAEAHVVGPEVNDSMTRARGGIRGE